MLILADVVGLMRFRGPTRTRVEHLRGVVTHLDARAFRRLPSRATTIVRHGRDCEHFADFDGDGLLECVERDWACHGRPCRPILTIRRGTTGGFDAPRTLDVDPST